MNLFYELSDHFLFFLCLSCLSCLSWRSFLLLFSFRCDLLLLWCFDLSPERERSLFLSLSFFLESFLIFFVLCFWSLEDLSLDLSFYLSLPPRSLLSFPLFLSLLCLSSLLSELSLLSSLLLEDEFSSSSFLGSLLAGLSFLR